MIGTPHQSGHLLNLSLSYPWMLLVFIILCVFVCLCVCVQDQHGFIYGAKLESLDTDHSTGPMLTAVTVCTTAYLGV